MHIRLSNDRPVAATGIRIILAGLDLGLIVYTNADRASALATSALGLVGFVALVRKRRPCRAAVAASMLAGAALGSANAAYAASRIGDLDIMSLSSPLHAWPAALSSTTIALGALVLLSYRSTRSNLLGVAIAGIGFWGPTLLWLGGVVVFNIFTIAIIGGRVYNYSQGMLTLLGALVFSTGFISFCALLRRVVTMHDASQQKQHL